MQQDDQQKNLLLAVALSAMVLLGWQLMFVNPRIKDEQSRKVAQQQSQQVPGTPGTSLVFRQRRARPSLLGGCRRVSLCP
jgi:hypothetical protein